MGKSESEGEGENVRVRVRVSNVRVSASVEKLRILLNKTAGTIDTCDMPSVAMSCTLSVAARCRPHAA